VHEFVIGLAIVSKMPNDQADENIVYLIRHGETEWARDGRHTGRADIPLTENGRIQAGYLLPIFEELRFSEILSSPLERALETARLAGVGAEVKVDPDLMEWNYGGYEGITAKQIREKVPGWTIWSHPCPNGETIQQVAARVDKVIARVRTIKGRTALFSHGHFLRVLAARWLGLDGATGRFFLLGTSTLSILGYEHDTPVIKTWNGPLITAACAVPWRQRSVP
jgi:broad specificity phosphatase PhoE